MSNEIPQPGAPGPEAPQPGAPGPEWPPQQTPQPEQPQPEAPQPEQPEAPQPEAPQPETPPAPAAGTPTSDEKMMGMLAHLLGLIGLIGPLIIWLIKKDESAYVKEQATEALNFQILVLIAFVASWIITLVTMGLASPLVFVVGIADLVLIIMATVQANQGVQYKYPVNWRLIK